MNIKELIKNKYYIASVILLFISLFLFFSPSIRNYFIDHNSKESRVVLSKIETNRLDNQLKFTLIKIKENRKLFLEIYTTMNHGLELVDKLPLEGEFDAFLMLKDRTSNLLISNIDRIDDLEVIAPTYDKKLKPILNVFKYDTNFEEFKRVNTKSNKPIL